MPRRILKFLFFIAKQPFFGDGSGREGKKSAVSPLSTPAEKNLVLLSASVERFGVSRMQIFFVSRLQTSHMILANLAGIEGQKVKNCTIALNLLRTLKSSLCLLFANVIPLKKKKP